MGTIVKRDSGYFLLFSDGREEGPFKTREAAIKREQQVNFFKHKSKGTFMEDLGIAAEYRINGNDEAIYIVADEEEIFPVLAKGPECQREVIEITHENVGEYAAILDYIFEESESLGGDTYRNRYWSNNPGGHNKNKFTKLKKRCAKCGKMGGMLDIHHKSGSRSDLKSGKGLLVLCRKCHRKLHQGKPVKSEGIELSTKDMSKVTLTIGSEDISILRDEEIDEKAFASAGQKKQKDLMYVKFILAHEGTNKNRDYFSRDELKTAAHTPVLKAINWEHGEPIIGTIYKSEYKEIDDPAFASAAADGKRGRIECEAVIWKYRYPVYAKAMVDRYMAKQLKFSMETYFGKCTCTECGEEFSSKNHTEGTYCDHLNYRKNSPDSKAARALQQNVFAGTGVVSNPADENADALAIAKEKEREEGSSVAEEKTFTQAELDDAVKRAVDAAKAEFESGKQLKEIADERDALKTQLSEVLEKVEAAEKERDKAKAEVEEIKVVIEKAKAIAGRMKQLSEAGYAIPDDEAELDEFRETVAGLTEGGFKLLLKSVFKPAEGKEREKEEEQAEASITVPATGGIAKASNNKQEDSMKALKTLVSAFLSDPTA